MAAMKTTATARTAVKKAAATAKNAVTRKTAKKADAVPTVTAERAGARPAEPWMTPAIKKTRAEYYAKLTGDINAAIAAAFARFRAEPTARWAFHLHHESLLEPIKGDYGETGLKGAVERMTYIAQGKNFSELLARFRVMRPVPQAKIVALQEATKAAEKEAALAEPPPHRITRDEVDNLAVAAEKKKRALDALDPKNAADSARAKVEDAWRRFHIESNGYYNKTYRVGNEAALDDLLRYAREWHEAANTKPDPAVLAAARAERDAAVKAHNDLHQAYYKQENERERAKYERDQSRPENVTDDQVWALHAEVCEPDCPYTKTHKSVIPTKK